MAEARLFLPCCYCHGRLFLTCRGSNKSYIADVTATAGFKFPQKKSLFNFQPAVDIRHNFNVVRATADSKIQPAVDVADPRDC